MARATAAQQAVLAGLAAAMLLAACHTANAMPCEEVADAFAPCLRYARYQDPRPSLLCCDGLQAITDAAQSTADKRAACDCLKTMLTAFSEIDPDEVAGIPSICGVNMPFALSATADCTRITLIDVA
jgi:hypothetical protein